MTYKRMSDGIKSKFAHVTYSRMSVFSLRALFTYPMNSEHIHIVHKLYKYIHIYTYIYIAYTYEAN